MRSYRTRLLSRIFGAKPRQRVGMQNFWLRQMLVDESLETLPRPPAALTAPPQGKQPAPRCFPPECVEPPQITRYCVIVEISLHHPLQPVPGLLDRIMPASAQFR